MTTDFKAATIPLYGTQGGGIATFQDGQYVWHSDIPDYLDARPGDPIPKEWSVVPINEAACHRVDQVDRYVIDDDDRFGDLVEDYLGEYT